MVRTVDERFRKHRAPVGYWRSLGHPSFRSKGYNICLRVNIEGVSDPYKGYILLVRKARITPLF